MRTYTPKAADIEHGWWLVDATDKPLGRLASEIARVIRGKHKPMYTPHLDTGDNVVVINAEKVILTGTKADKKTYFRHSGYMGGEKHIPAHDPDPPRARHRARGEGHAAEERPGT